MTMFNFMVNAFYLLCGIVCIGVAVVVAYCVIAAFLKEVRKWRK